MRRRVLRALLWGTGALGLAACAAITGAADLTVGGNAAAAEDDGGASDGGTDGALVPPCARANAACEGHELVTCEGNTPVRTVCPQTCEGNACAPWPSCADLADAGCGADGTSCCASATVPGGTFNRHNDAQRPATISTFKLDLFTVTVGRFRRFVTAGLGTQAMPPAAGAGAHPKIAGSGWQSTWNQYLPSNAAALVGELDDLGATWTSMPGANEKKPIVNVTWLVAFAFCAWDGGRLPTRAELSYAATGGSEQRVYPWSNPPSSTAIAANSQANYNCAFDPPAYNCPLSYCNLAPQNSPCSGAVLTNCTADGGTCITPPCAGCEGAIDIAPVGTYTTGAGRWGHFELAGNVKQFVLDVYPQSGDPPAGACNDCALLMPADPDPPMAGKEKVVLMGGDFNDTSPTSLRNSSFIDLDFDTVSAFSGFRCARD